MFGPNLARPGKLELVKFLSPKKKPMANQCAIDL